MTVATLTLIAGFIFLVIGGHYLVQGAVGIALLARISVTIVALTVVAMGTSMPELLVGVVASVRHSPDITIGNVVGSNIANIALILGIAALIRPVRVQMRLLVREVPIMIFATLAFYIFALDHELSRGDGIFLGVGFIAYTLYLLEGARRESPAVEVGYQKFVPAGGTLAGHVAGGNRSLLDGPHGLAGDPVEGVHEAGLSRHRDSV